MVVSWTCSAGYAAIGSSTRTCLSSGVRDVCKLPYRPEPSAILPLPFLNEGNWSGTPFACVLIAPSFSGLTISIMEGSALGFVVGTLNATTASSMPIFFYILGGNTGGAFALNVSSGSLTVANPSMLVYATNPVFSLAVIALTNGDASAVTQGIVTITLVFIPKPPLLVTTAVSIYVNASVGQAAFPVIIASDDSGAATIFSLPSTSGTNFSVVQVGNNSAVLVLQVANVLNNWVSPTLVVTVVLSSARNASLTTVATVIVNVLYAPTPPIVNAGQVNNTVTCAYMTHTLLKSPVRRVPRRSSPYRTPSQLLPHQRHLHGHSHFPR